jgi:hypothetical protein
MKGIFGVKSVDTHIAAIICIISLYYRYVCSTVRLKLEQIQMLTEIQVFGFIVKVGKRL